MSWPDEKSGFYSARTDMWRVFRHAICLSKTGASNIQNPADYNSLRRASHCKLVFGAKSGLTAAYAGSAFGRLSSSVHRVAIVGAGLAGLNVAYVLKQHGCTSTVYEASSMAGGRIRTDFGNIEPGILTELGGEFIDSSHKDMLALASQFNLPLIDTGIDSEKLKKTAYFFEGHHFSEAQVVTAFRDIAPRIVMDAAKLSSHISYSRHTPADIIFDQTSLSQYFDQIGLHGWLRKLIEVAYVTEYGLEISEQSSINFLSLIGTETSNEFELYGKSDERFKIQQGNEKIVQHLRDELSQHLNFEHKLVRIRKHAAG